MKHVLNSTLFVIALIAIAGFFYACNQDELEEVSQESDFTVRVKNGYLEFKDQATFNETKLLLEDRDSETLDAWEHQFKGFISLRNINEQSIVAQEAYYEKLEKLDSKELTKARKSEGFFYSDFFKDKSNVFVLQDSGRYSLNLPYRDSEIAGFINSDGLLKIGTDLYQYEKESVKIIHDGDESKLNLLPKFAQSNKEHNITVHTIQESVTDLNDNSTINARFVSSGSCTGDSGRDRIRCSAINGFSVYVVVPEKNLCYI